jgi:hypothetical protein
LRRGVAVAVLALLLVPAPSRAAAPRVLLTGDSMMENIAAPLAASLRGAGAEVVVDHVAGSGLSTSWFDWRAYARRQMSAAPAPSVTVMFNGAGDVWPLPVDGRPVRCCRASWRAAYARRAASLMRTYGRVYWLTLPMPRNRGHAQVMAAVNAAVRDAARQVGSSATVVDLVPVLTPRRRFRRTLRGRVIRRSDGIHLTAAGAELATSRVRAAMTELGR